MRGEEEQIAKRLAELAVRAERTGHVCFSDFLSPAEAQWAESAARRQKIRVGLEGGYEDAERRIACFSAEPVYEDFPIAAIELTWPHQKAPEHRDILGSVLGLGLGRQCVGDIVPTEERAYLFCQRRMADHIAASLLGAGRVRLQTRVLDQLPRIQPPEGTPLHDTVSSLRLDAVIAAGFDVSRADAAQLIAAGRAKLRHLPEERPDARVQEGDVISLRGYGRLAVEAVGQPTRKGRLPLNMTRYGKKR